MALATQLGRIDASTISATLEILEAHAAARGVLTEHRTIAVVGGHDLGVSIGGHERVEVLARGGRLAVLATSLAAAHRCLDLLDELSITNQARRERALGLRALLAELIDRWDALYERFPHVALDELRTEAPRARVLVGLVSVTLERAPQVMYGATTCEPRGEPFVWSSDRQRFSRAPGIVLAKAPRESRVETVLSGCDPGCFDVLSLLDVVDCDPGCF